MAAPTDVCTCMLAMIDVEATELMLAAAMQHVFRIVHKYILIWKTLPPSPQLVGLEYFQRRFSLFLDPRIRLSLSGRAISFCGVGEVTITATRNGVCKPTTYAALTHTETIADRQCLKDAWQIILQHCYERLTNHGDGYYWIAAETRHRQQQDA